MSEKTAKTKKIIKSPKAAPPIKKERYFEAVGRRKTSVARVRLYPKSNGLKVNNRDIGDYFPVNRVYRKAVAPLEKMNVSEKFGAEIKVKGGGLPGQADAIRLGIARALVKYDSALKKRLRNSGYLTRDQRAVERKKFGLKKARKASQWRKR